MSKEKCKCIIAGGRNFKSMEILIEAIKASGFKIDEVVHGDAKGADTLGGKWAESQKIPVKKFPAKWNDIKHPEAKIKTNSWGKEYDVTAGFRRNQEMADYATHCIAVEGGNGTEDMIKRARESGLVVYVHGDLDGETYDF